MLRTKFLTVFAVVSTAACGSFNVPTNSANAGTPSNGDSSSISSNANAPTNPNGVSCAPTQGPHLNVQSPNLLYTVTTQDANGQTTTTNTPLPFVVITEDPNLAQEQQQKPGVQINGYTLALFSYDPCAYEYAHGAFTAPGDGVVVQYTLSAQNANGTPVLDAGSYANASGARVAPFNQIQVINPNFCLGLPRVVEGQPTLTLNGTKQGLDCNTVADGTGVINTLVAAPSDAPQEVIHGTFTAGHCVDVTNPMPAVDPNAPDQCVYQTVNTGLQTAVF